MNNLANLLSEPGKAERRAFAALTRDAAADLKFSVSDLVLIREALRIAEATLQARSAAITVEIDSGKRFATKARLAANDAFTKSLDCAALADRISASMRRARG